MWMFVFYLLKLDLNEEHNHNNIFMEDNYKILFSVYDECSVSRIFIKVILHHHWQVHTLAFHIRQVCPFFLLVYRYFFPALKQPRVYRYFLRTPRGHRR